MPMKPISLKRLAPSMRISGDTVLMSINDLRKMVQLIAERIAVDESWYLSQYKDVATAVQKGAIPSAAAHYRTTGFNEGRLPVPPEIDDRWYLKTYPDVAKAIQMGQVPSAKEHFIVAGFREGRLPAPSSND